MKLLPSFSVLTLPEKIQNRLSSLKEEHLLFSNLIDYRLNPSDFLKNTEVQKQTQEGANVTFDSQKINDQTNLEKMTDVRAMERNEKNDQAKKSCFLLKTENQNSQAGFFINDEEKIVIGEIVESNSICSLERKRPDAYYLLGMLMYFFLAFIKFAGIKKRR